MRSSQLEGAFVNLIKSHCFLRKIGDIIKEKCKEVVFMSELQQKAIGMINGLSDDNISFLIEIINRLMPLNEKDRKSVV